MSSFTRIIFQKILKTRFLLMKVLSTLELKKKGLIVFETRHPTYVHHACYLFFYFYRYVLDYRAID